MNPRSAWLIATGQTREDTRLAPLGAFTPTSALATRSGILPGSPSGQYLMNGFTLTGSTAMTATVSPGRAVIQGTDAQGAYPVVLTGYPTLTFDAGDPQYKRIDLVVVRVYDTAYDGSGRTEAVVEIVKGTPAATPAAPAVPPLSLPLYEVTVPAGASAGNGGITWATALVGRRTTTVAAGGILPLYTDSAIGSYPGQYRDINGHLERWDGGAWKQYPPVPVWQSWTPVWSTTSGAALPSYGNATVACRYVQNGPTVHLAFEIVFGTTTVFGNGGFSDNYTFSLPVAAASTLPCLGFAELNSPAAGGQRVIARLRGASTTAFQLETSSGRPDAIAVANTGLVDAITPWTWGSGHAIRGTATYEAA